MVSLLKIGPALLAVYLQVVAVVSEMVPVDLVLPVADKLVVQVAVLAVADIPVVLVVAAVDMLVAVVRLTVRKTYQLGYLLFLHR